jgi:hypothetical protein
VSDDNKLPEGLEEFLAHPIDTIKEGAKSAGQAIINSEPVQNIITGKGLDNYKQMLEAARRGDPEAELALAGHSLGSAMGTLSSAPGVKVLDVAPQGTTRSIANAVGQGIPVTPQGVQVPTYGKVILKAEGGDIQAPEGLDSFLSGDVSAPPSGLPSLSSSSIQPPSEMTSLPPAPQGLDEFIAPEMKAKKYGTLEQQIKTGLESTAQGLVGPLAPLAETQLGIAKPEDILARQEVNPGIHMAGEITGLVLPALVTAGMSTEARAGLEGVAQSFTQSGLLEKAGEAVGKMLPESTSLASKIGTTAAKAAVENMLLAGSDEVSRMILQDPNQSAETAITDIGLAGVLGAGIGGALGAVNPLWRAAVGDKAGKLAADFKGRIAEHINNPEPHTAITEELNNYFSELKKIGSETYGDTGIKAQAIQKAVPELHEGIVNQVQDVASKLSDKIEQLGAKGDPHVGLLQDKLTQFNREVNSNEPYKIFDAIQNLKKGLQEESRYTEGVSPLSERAYRKTVKDLAHDLRTALEDTSVWGDAGKLQSGINSAFSDYLKATKDFRGLMTTEVMGERVVNPAKVQTYLNQLGKPAAEIKMEKMKNFLDAGEKLKSAVNKAYEKLGVDSPVLETSLNNTLATLEKKTTGAKLADAFIEKGLTDAGGKGLGGAFGAALGHMVGHEGLGAILGAHTLGPMFSTILPGIAKAVVSKEASGAGLKAAVDYAANVSSGQKALSKATENLFKDTPAVLADHMYPTERDRSRLEKALGAMRKDPQGFARNSANDKTSHYLPEHAAAVAFAASNAATYLNNLRFNQGKKAPLDSTPVPSAADEAKYKRALDIAQQPLIIMDKIKKGTVTSHDIQHLQAMYPSLYGSIKKQIVDKMSDHLSRGRAVPYQTRIGLSMFLGQPLDSSMSQQYILAAQVGHPTTQQNSQAIQSSMAPRGSKSAPALQKMPSNYMTSSQSKESHRQQKG